MAEETTPAAKPAKPAKAAAAKKPAAKATAKKPAAKKAAKPAAKAAKPAAKKSAPKASKAKAEQTRQVEVIARILTELARTNFEETVEAARAVVKSGSLKKAIELQGKLVRATLQRNVAATREINKIAGDSVRHIAAPITERISDAFSSFRK